MIDLTINKKILDENIGYFRQRKISLPTFAMMRDPRKVPHHIKEGLKKVGLWDNNPLNLYRITWKNEQKDSGGLFGKVNHIVLPPRLTGCRAKIVAISGRWFPTGAHKVGATFGCLVPKLVTGQFSPARDHAVWPSTGNFCRGGAYISTLMGCKSIAILPEEMSKERFDWLRDMAGEVIATPGCESNVKEIFDKCWELRKTRDDINIFNQFEELGNPLWHYNVTGAAIEELTDSLLRPGERLMGGVFSSGSGGTMASGYYLKNRLPNFKLAVAEAQQCPTLLQNGFGGHRIEGIGDKHVPWVHDVKSTDMVIAVDDEVTMRLLRLFNDKRGHEALCEEGVSRGVVDNLHLLGISGIGNMVAAIKMAKFYELTESDYVATVLTDSMQLYGSRLEELEAERGPYSDKDVYRDIELINSIAIDNTKELGYYERKAIHNLKYFTWIEQQGRELQELNAQWYDHENYWKETMHQSAEIDQLIMEFNERVSL